MTRIRRSFCTWNARPTKSNAGATLTAVSKWPGRPLSSAVLGDLKALGANMDTVAGKAQGAASKAHTACSWDSLTA